ncbi:MOSC domain-containing protein [Asticcacaulis solisilvae]|uniref:MOSC domain-containing protein n=1 Tax=Asticcacaulis solisilvae TaxID=1217274 RepID=UPI003FD8939D
MLNASSPLARLMNAPVRPGVVEWIGVRPERRAPMRVMEAAELDPAQGVIGDRYAGKSGNRHVTLIGRADLAAIADFLGLDEVPPDLLRRNIVVSGVNLLALKEKRFRLGGALLEMTGECHPCSRMEEIFGEGGYNAVRGHGGITARVLAGGTVGLGDALEVVAG